MTDRSSLSSLTTAVLCRRGDDGRGWTVIAAFDAPGAAERYLASLWMPSGLWEYRMEKIDE